MVKTIWLFGPSGTGKTTLGHELQGKLQQRGREVVLLDGDDLRKTVNRDLGFSYLDRMQQTVRAASLAKAVNESGKWAIVCLITPFAEFRAKAASVIGRNLEMVYVQSGEKTRIERDPKGLYARAIAGTLPSPLTGYDGAFDEPKDGDAMVINTDDTAPSEGASSLLKFLIGKKGWQCL